MYYTYYHSKKVPEKPNFFNLIFNTAPKTYTLRTIQLKHPKPYIFLSAKQKEQVRQAEYSLKKCYLTMGLFEKTHENDYFKFFIPKRNHKLREINAPNNEFKETLANTKDTFQNEIRCLSHPAAYAYIPHTSTLDALKLHQNNESKWFLKIDLKDFFPSCTPELLYTKLKNLYPFYYLDKEHSELLKKILHIASLNGSLPQGSPFSPYLSNLVMVEYDFKIQALLKTKKSKFIYTRYADDILISSPYDFNWRTIQNEIEELLSPAFTINTEKTRYGSQAGSNWNLGLMLNKDNNITLGHIKKRTLNAMLNNFFSAFNDNEPWSVPDTQILQGQLSYLAHIEPEYCRHIIQKYQKKYTLNYHEVLSSILNPN